MRLCKLGIQSKRKSKEIQKIMAMQQTWRAVSSTERGMVVFRRASLRKIMTELIGYL